MLLPSVRQRLSAARLLITLLLAMASISSCADKPTAKGQPSDASRLAGVIGHRWRVVEVRHGGATVPIPDRLHGYLGFAPDGHLGIDDTLNYHFGRFEPTERGFRAVDMGTTLVGGGRGDVAQDALIDSITALTDGGVDVTTQVVDGRLTLTGAGYRVTCVHDGTFSAPPMPSPTPSATFTSAASPQ